MSKTAVPTIMDIVEDMGGSGNPKTVVEALNLLRMEVAGVASDPITNDEIDAITESQGGTDND